jgi:hypothetical protein
VNPLALGALAATRRTASALGWTELGLKLEAYEIFRRGGQGELGRRPLRDGVARAFALAPGRIVWSVEGLGHAYALENARADPGRWLRDAIAEAPPAARIPLLAGIGLALAETRLPELVPAAPAERSRRLAYDLAAWREALPPSYADVLVEGQGFATRLLHPRLLAPLAASWAEQDEAWALAFQHGVGRASYLDARRAVPWSPVWRTAAWRDQTASAVRAELLAGLAFAVTLVTLREPRRLERLLLDHAPEPHAAPALTHGIGSAIRLWHETAPADPVLAAWRRHQPRDAEGARRWREWVGEPCAAALSLAPPSAAPAEIFRYAPSRRP